MILTHGANSLAMGGGDTVTIGGRAYKTVTIGNQVWLAENLDYKFDGCDIGPTGSPSTPAAWYYDNDEATYGIDGPYKSGLFYTWYAVKVLNDNRSEWCPGWHVPSSSEWDALFTAIGGLSTAGTKMKATDGSILQNYPSGWNGDNNYGFSVLPTGNRSGWYQLFVNLGTHTRFWKSPIEYDYNEGYFIQFSTSEPVTEGTDLKIDAYPVRLVKDAT